MNRLNLPTESLNGILIRSCLILGLIISLYAPNSLFQSPYILQYSAQIIITFLILILAVSEKKIKISKKNLIGVITFSLITILLSVFSFLNTALISNNIYDFRDGIRPIAILFVLVAIFVSSSLINKYKLAAQIYVVSTIFIITNSLLSLIWFFESTYLSNLINLFVAPSDPIFKAGYWRYTGFLGNPNYNAIATITTGIYVFFYPAKNKYIKVFTLILVIPILMLSSSRTVIAAVVIMMFISFNINIYKWFINYKSNYSKISIILLPVVLIITGYLLIIDIENYFLIRFFLSFSYAEDERSNIVNQFIYYFLDNPVHFFFGKFGDIDIYGYTFTDNDYLLLITKYGFFQLINIIVAIFLFWYSASIRVKKNTENRLLNMGYKIFIWSLIFILIVSMGSAIASAPCLIYLPLICITFVLNNHHKMIN